MINQNLTKQAVKNYIDEIKLDKILENTCVKWENLAELKGPGRPKVEHKAI